MPFLLIIVALMTFSAGVNAHGIKSSSATVEVLPNRLVNIKVQFHMVDVLHAAPGTSALTLPVVAAMPEQMFASLYEAMLAEFDVGLQASLLAQPGLSRQSVVLNKRLPSAQQVQGVLKRELVESKYAGQGKPPYTFNDRRFYQIFNYDFRLAPGQSIDDLKIVFPAQLGEIFVSFTAPQTRNVAPGETWSIPYNGEKRLND